MMGFIFRQVSQVRDGSKIETRRVAQLGERGAYFNTILPFFDAVSSPNGRMKWCVGMSYAAVPGRGMKRFGNIRIKSIRLEHLQQMSDEDARAEGCADLAEYRRLWDSINGARTIVNMAGKRQRLDWASNPLVWVVRFEYLGDAARQSETEEGLRLNHE